MPLDRRLQLLLDEGRYRRLAVAARERGVSVAAVIRDAIDQAVPDDIDRKRDAAAAILAVEPMAVPATAAELKTELDEARAGGL
jgi:prephenate dehydrogenase